MAGSFEKICKNINSKSRVTFLSIESLFGNIYFRSNLTQNFKSSSLMMILATAECERTDPLKLILK